MLSYAIRVRSDIGGLEEPGVVEVIKVVFLGLFDHFIVDALCVAGDVGDVKEEGECEDEQGLRPVRFTGLRMWGHLCELYFVITSSIDF